MYKAHIMPNTKTITLLTINKQQPIEAKVVVNDVNSKNWTLT